MFGFIAGSIVCQVDLATGSIAVMSQTSSSAMHTHMYGSIRHTRGHTDAQSHSKNLADDDMRASLLKKLGLLDQLPESEVVFEAQHSIAGLADSTFDASAMAMDPAALDSSFHLAALPRPGSLCVPGTIQAFYTGLHRVRPLWTGCAYRPVGQSALSSNWMGSAEGQVLGSVQDLLAKPLQSSRRRSKSTAGGANILYQTLTQASHSVSGTAVQTGTTQLRLESRLGLAAAAIHALAITQQAQRTARLRVSCHLSTASDHVGGTRSLTYGPMLTSLLKSVGLESKGLYGETLARSYRLPDGRRPIRHLQMLVGPGETQQIPHEESITAGTSFAPHFVEYQAPLVSPAGAGPFPLLPQPRGALQNLQPAPLNPKVQPGRVWLKTHAVGVNFRDVLNVLGMYPGDPGPPGADCAGVVVATGAGVTNLTPGMAVFGLAPGCLGSHVHVSASCVVPMPAQLNHTEAATIPTVYITAHTAFRQASVVRPGDRVLVHAAAGGVGLAAVQVLAEAQAEVFATAGGPSKRSLLRQLRIQHVLDSRSTTMASDVAHIGGVNVVLNSLTSPGMVAGSAAGVRLGGRFVEISKRDIWSPARLAQERPDLHCSLLAVDFLPPSEIQSGLMKLTTSLAAGLLRPLPQAVHDSASVHSALRQMSQARHVGKVVVRNSQQDSTLSGMQGSVMITGGLGSLGTTVAAWLSKQRVQHVQLTGRTGKLSKDTAHALADATHPFCQSEVIVHRADTSCSEEAEALTAAAAPGQLPQLQGIMHASGVLADATFGNQSATSLRQAFAPKTFSAANLHRATQHSLSIPGAVLIRDSTAGWYGASQLCSR